MTVTSRAVAATLASALAGVLLFGAVSIRHRHVGFDMNRLIPRPAAAGFHGPESDGGETVQWTAGRALLRLSDLDRRVAWSCVTRLRAPRAANAPPTSVELHVDNGLVTTAALTAAFDELRFSLPPRSARGATIAIASEPNWNPGGGDPRTLGVQVDWVRCEPASRWVLPPLGQSLYAAVIPAAMGLAVALAGGWLIEALIIPAIVAFGFAVLSTSGAAPFLKYSSTTAVMALSVAGAFLLIVRIIEAIRRRPLQRPALIAAALSAGALILKLAALFHPSMPLGDSVFQAHRLSDVLSGQYIFRQQVGETRFPYAIGLYVFAAPWAGLTSHTTEALVVLLRIVVASSEAIAGGLLYLVAVRAWNRPSIGVAAVALFHAVPLPYMVIANGNLTNAFAQSVALIALAAATLARPTPHRALKIVGIALLLALAFSAHITTIVLLLSTIAAVVAIGFVTGGESRAAAMSLVAATVLALAFAWVTYYGQFMDDYLQAIARMRARVADVVPAPSSAPAAGPAADATDARTRAEILWSSRPARARAALWQIRDQLGWPLLGLTVLGLGAIRVSGAGARPSHLIIAWLAVWLVFLVVGAVSRTGPQYGPYVIEFLGRVNLAVYPAVILLASRGLVGVWQPSAHATRFVLARRAVAIVLAAAAWGVGSAAWTGWVR